MGQIVLQLQNSKKSLLSPYFGWGVTPPTPPPGGPVGNQKTGGIGGELIGDPEMCIFLIIGFYLLTL